MESGNLSVFVLMGPIKNKKCIVFFSSCNCVKCTVYRLLPAKDIAKKKLSIDHSELLNYIDLPV